MGDTLFITHGYYDDPDPSEVMVATGSLPNLWIKTIKLHNRRTNGPLEEDEAGSDQDRRTRTDGLKTAMVAGIAAYENKHRTGPTARALFDWLAHNDETGIIEEFDCEKDSITWRRADGGLSDTSFKAFQGRFTNLKK